MQSGVCHTGVILPMSGDSMWLAEEVKAAPCCAAAPVPLATTFARGCRTYPTHSISAVWTRQGEVRCQPGVSVDPFTCGTGAALGDPEEHVFIVSLARRPEKRSRVLRQLEEHQLSLDPFGHSPLCCNWIFSLTDVDQLSPLHIHKSCEPWGMQRWWTPWMAMVFSIKMTWMPWVFGFCLVTIQASAITTCPTLLERCPWCSGKQL